MRTYGLGYLFTATANNGIGEGRRISEQIIMHFAAYVLSNPDNSVLGDVISVQTCHQQEIDVCRSEPGELVFELL
jgi:hypothetical protein